MAERAKVAPVSYSSLVPPQSATINGLKAGENIAAGDVCRIAAAGTVFRASGAANDANSVAYGFAFTDASNGEAVTLVCEGNWRYATGMTPGTLFYLSGTVAGGLADAASVGGTVPIAIAIDDTRIRIVPAGLFI